MASAAAAAPLASPACDVSEWINASWHRCMFQPARDASGGEPLLALLVSGGTLIGLYFAGGGSLATPSVLAIIFGGLLAQSLPAGLVPFAWAIMYAGFVGGLISLGRRYILDPGAR